MTALEFPLTDRRDVPDESRAEPALHCSHLVRRFGERTVVDDVSLTIAPGESYGLLGPNGAGKTTIIRMVCGLLRANSGSIRVAGRLVDDNTTSAKSDIGFVPQDVALYPDLSAGENLRFFGRLYGLRGQLLNQRVGDILALIDLTDRGDDRVESFSGGMKRLLNIGAALMPQPSLLVLDEPTVGVDPQAGHAILDSVARIGASGMAVLYTTHYMEEAERVCDRVGIIDRGRLIAEGTRRELVALLEEHDRIELTVSRDPNTLLAACRAIDGIDEAGASADQVHLLARGGRRTLARVFEQAERTGVSIRTADVVEPDLEAVFLRLTGTALRE